MISLTQNLTEGAFFLCTIVYYTLNEFGIAKIEKVIKEFMEDKDRNLGDLVMELEKPMQICAR